MHIYGCYKRRLVTKHGFAEFCFQCSEWVIGEEGWKDHCQIHLDTPESLPVQCNPLIYGGAHASPGFCPCHLGNETLLATERMAHFLDTAEWRRHIAEHVLEYTKRLTELKCPPTIAVL